MGAHLVGQCRTARYHHFEAVEEPRLIRRQPSHSLDQRRNRRQNVGPVALEQIEEGLEFEAREHHHLGAVAQGHVHADGHGEDVEEWQDGDDLAGRIEKATAPGIDLAHVGGDVGVAQHGPLGEPSRAARILLYRNISEGIDLDRLRHAAFGDKLMEPGRDSRR